MRTKYLALFAVITIVCTVVSLAHGLKIEVRKEAPCFVLTSKYRGGNPIAAADVKVFQANQKTAYQAGQTDPHGRFVFVPDQEGDWFFQVDDGMGHRKKITIHVDATFFAKEKGTVENTNTSQVVDVPGTEMGHDEHEHHHAEPGSKQTIETAGSKPGQDSQHKQTGTPAKEAQSEPKDSNNDCDGNFYCKLLLGVVLIGFIFFIVYTMKKKQATVTKNKE